MTITEFLEARIAEDEAQAKYVQQYGHTNGLALFSTARVLAECAAKRAVLDHAIDLRSSYAEELNAGVADSERIVGKDGWLYPFDADPILRVLAAVYASHPDYEPDWEL